MHKRKHWIVAAGLAVCGLLLLFFGRSFLGLFANETEVIDAGMQRLRIMSFSYVVSPLMDTSIAASRGIGKSATEFLEVSEIAVPVGLGNDGYPIAVGFQYSSEDGRAEGWVVNVSIS